MNCQRCGSALAPKAQFCPECGTRRPRPAPRFLETEEEFASLRARFSDGHISAADYDAALKRLVVKDDDGAHWMIGVESGEWHRWDGQSWVREDPPAQTARPTDLPEDLSRPPEWPAKPSGLLKWVAIGIAALGLTAVCIAAVIVVIAFAPSVSTPMLAVQVSPTRSLPVVATTAPATRASPPVPSPAVATVTRSPSLTDLPSPSPAATITRQPPTPTPSPTRMPTKIPASPSPSRTLIASSPCPIPGGAALFSDDFTNPSSGWTAYRGVDYEHYYENGEFHFAATKPNFTGNAWILLRDQGPRYVVSVRSHKVGGPDMNNYGLLFGGQDDANYYAFRISDSGSYRVARQAQGQWQDLVAWTKTSLINVGAWNTLSAVVQDSRVTVCLNGQALKALDDTALGAGRVGLIAGAFDEPSHIHFDDFVVTLVR